MNSGESEREEKKRIRVGVNEIGAILLSLIFFLREQSKRVTSLTNACA